MYLTEEARRLLLGLDLRATFEYARDLILKTYKLSSGKYKQMYQNLVKVPSETYSQFVSKLVVQLNYYLDSQKIRKSYETLFNLLIADRLRDTLNPFYCAKVLVFEDSKKINPVDVAEMLDILISETEEFQPQYSRPPIDSPVPMQTFDDRTFNCDIEGLYSRTI